MSGVEDQGLQAALGEARRLAVVGRLDTSGAADFDRLARSAARQLGAPVGIVNLIGADTQRFVGCCGVAAEWDRHRRMPVGEGFCPHTVALGVPLSVPDVAASPVFAANPVAGYGIRAYAGVPLRIDGAVVGTVCVLDRRPRAWTGNDLAVLAEVASSVVAELRVRLVAGQQARLLEAFTTAPCLVAVTAGAGHRVVFANQAWAEAATGTPGTDLTGAVLDVPGPDSADVIAAVEAAYHQARHTTVRARLPERHGRRTRWIAYTVSPRLAPSGTAMDGVLVVGTDVTDTVAAEGRLREAAETLQRSLMVAEPAPVAGLDLVARYRPGAEPRRPARRASDVPPGEDPPTVPLPVVGGDWYDVIPLGMGRTALVIGDVMGRGIDAAAVMGQLRTAVRVLAAADPDPADVLARLDALLGEIAPEQLATCVYAVHDLTAGEVAWANAGHVPPLLARPGTGVGRLDGGVDTPLGVDGEPYRSFTTTAEPGDVLALYTDGLVGHHGNDIDDGLATLAACLDHAHAETPGGLADIAATILDWLHPAGIIPDDTALLLVRIPPAAHTMVREALPPGPAAAGAARRATRAALTAWAVPEDVIDAAELIASELAANARVHADATGPVELRLLHTSGVLGIEVSDTNPRAPHRRAATSDEEHGRGLDVIARLATRWGCRPTADGKTVWCEIRTTATTPRTLLTVYATAS